MQAGALQAVATVLATMPAAVPVIWLGTKGTVWRSRGASTACRPPVSPGCAPVVAPNDANLLATQPVRRTSFDTGLYPTGGRHRNTAESFAPYREKVFEGLANTLGIAVGSSAAYDGDGKARGHDGPALTGLLLTAFQLSFNPGHVAGKTGGVGLPGGGTVAGTFDTNVTIRADSSDERFARGAHLLMPVVVDWTAIAEAPEGASSELLEDLKTIRQCCLPSARSAGFVNEFAVIAWVMQVTRSGAPVPKEVSDSQFFKPGDEELRELSFIPTGEAMVREGRVNSRNKTRQCDLLVIAPAGQQLLHASRVLGTAAAAAAAAAAAVVAVAVAAADSSSEALVERHAISMAKAKRLIDAKIRVLRAQTRGSSNDALLSATKMVLREGAETWTGGRTTGYIKKTKQYSVHWDGDRDDTFTLHSFEEMCRLVRCPDILHAATSATVATAATHARRHE